MVEAIDRPAFERAVASRLVTGGKLDQAAIDRVTRLQTSSEERLEALLACPSAVDVRAVDEDRFREAIDDVLDCLHERLAVRGR